MDIQNKKSKPIITAAAFVQFLFCLIVLNTSDNYFHESTTFYLAFFSCSLALCLLLILFFRIATKTLKVSLFIYMPCTLILFLWHNGVFDTISINDSKTRIKDKVHFEILVNVGNTPFDVSKLYIDLEQHISSLPDVDSVFIVGVDKLAVPVLEFAVNEEVCKATGISSTEFKGFIDSVMTLSPPADRYRELDTLKFKGIPINAHSFVSVSVKSVDYKKNFIKPRNEDDHLDENEAKFLVYCLCDKQNSIIEKIVDQLDSLRSFLPHELAITIQDD